jgi:flagellar basal-body rod protein FlgB
MLNNTITFQTLSDAIERSALRQAVYAANIANANVPGFERMEVAFDAQVARANLALGNREPSSSPFRAETHVVSTHEAVKLDEEMAHVAKNALQYQVLVGAYEKQVSLLRMAVKDGRE